MLFERKHLTLLNDMYYMIISLKTLSERNKIKENKIKQNKSRK